MIARGSVPDNCGLPGSVSDPWNQNLWLWGLGRCFEGAVPGGGFTLPLNNGWCVFHSFLPRMWEQAQRWKVTGFVGITMLSAGATRRTVFFSRMSHELMSGQSLCSLSSELEVFD